VLDRLLRRDHSGVRHFASLRHHGAISYAAWLATGALSEHLKGLLTNVFRTFDQYRVAPFVPIFVRARPVVLANQRQRL
jgi:hypothetical protein